MKKIPLVLGIFLISLFITASAQTTEEIRQEYCKENWREAPDMCPEFVIKNEPLPTPEEIIDAKELQEEIKKQQAAEQANSQGFQFHIIDQNTIIGIVVFIIILVIIIGIAKSRSSQQESTGPMKIPRNEFTPTTKELVKEKQSGRCNKCGKIPTHWSFHHKGRRDDNSIHNCMGLCLDCHEDYTRTQKKDHHSAI